MENLRELHIGNILTEYIDQEGIKFNDIVRKLKISKNLHGLK